MSTYAVIAIKRTNGTINLTRLLQNGDPENAGATLCTWYKTTEQVEALLALGVILNLDTTPEKSAAQPNSLPGYVRDTGMLVRNFDMTDFTWEKKDGVLTLNVALPEGTRMDCEVVLPDGTVTNQATANKTYTCNL